MSLLRRRAPSLVPLLALVAALGASLCAPLIAPLRAQDTTVAGVRIGLVYAGARPGVLVLPVDGTAGDSIRAILQRDFQHGDRIDVVALAPSAIPPFGNGTTAKPNYALFTRLGAAAILQVTPTSFGIQVAVHNAAKGVVERAKAFPLPAGALSADWRLALHAVADEIEQWITGVRGVAATRILYVSGGRVWQVDSDGANALPITSGGTAMSPVWHPKASHIAYMTMGPTGQQIVVREIGGATRVLPTRAGLNMTPTFAPDGYTLAYAHGGESGTDLYATNAFGTDPARRITVGRGSDNTQPSFSPDGRRLAFTSGRLGHPEVYISDADGTNADLLTRDYVDEPYRANPDWSPDGRLIAFEAQLGGRMQVMSISLRDRLVKRHTSEGANEQPSWAPDSRHVVFTSDRGGSRQLWVLDVESNTVRQLTRAPAGARFGAWSPPLLRTR